MNLFLRWRLYPADYELIGHLGSGSTLKSHRFLDGQKRYTLYGPDEEQTDVAWKQVQRLLRLKIITTNQKFPAATFLLTNKGQALVNAKGIRGVGSIVKFDS